MSVAAAGLAAFLLCAWIGLHFVPLPPALFVPPPPSLEFADRHGRPLREVSRTELVTRISTLADVPQSLIDATLAAEDRRFWDHAGVDWRATARAAWQWARHRRVVSGGSTLTQQVIKLAQPRPRTLRTKLIEALQALRLEQIWTKQQILATYLNRLDYGNLRRGSASAAAFYFGRALPDLSVAEAAFLAGLPQAPTRLNPYAHFESAKRRQAWILDRMRAMGWLSEADAERARNAHVPLLDRRRDFAAPHFVDLLLQTQTDGIGVHSGGSLRTTLDLELQRMAERCLRDQLARLRGLNVQQGAVVVLDVRSGEVLTLVGSGNYFSPDAGQVNGAWARRSAGSTFKPFTYLIALERGATPATVIADVPTEFATATGVFAPVNYDRRCHGPTRYREALANSLNIPAVRLLNELGGAAVLHQRLTACGLTTLDEPADHYGLGLTIGNAEARLLELANTYACLARLGQFRPFLLLPKSSSSSSSSSLYSSSSSTKTTTTEDDDEDEDESEEDHGRGQRVFDPDAAWLIADILSDNAARALAFGLDSPLRFDFPVASKTGTSTDFRDNWALGYTPEFVVGVWVGNFDGTPMQGVSGVSGAAPILRDVMLHLHERFGTGWYAPPATLVELCVHAVTGKRVTQPRAGTLRERFIASATPPFEPPDDYDLAGRVRLPAEYGAWFASGDNWLAGQAVLVTSAEATEAEAASPLRVLQPLPASVFVLDPDLPDSGHWLRLRAEASGPVTWSSPTLVIDPANGRPCARLTEGRHELVVREALTGSEGRTWIEVRRL